MFRFPRSLLGFLALALLFVGCVTAPRRYEWNPYPPLNVLRGVSPRMANLIQDRPDLPPCEIVTAGYPIRSCGLNWDVNGDNEADFIRIDELTGKVTVTVISVGRDVEHFLGFDRELIHNERVGLIEVGEAVYWFGPAFPREPRPDQEEIYRRQGL